MTQSTFQALLSKLSPKMVTPQAFTTMQRIANGRDNPQEYWASKLIEALKKQGIRIEEPEQLLNNPEIPDNSTETETAPIAPPAPEPPKIAYSDQPKIVLPAAKRLHKKHGHFHALMVNLAFTNPDDRETLADYAKIVMETTRELDRMYDNFRDGKPIPEDDPETETQDPQKRKHYLKCRISALKNKHIPAAKTAKRKAELQNELDLKRAEYESL